MAKPATIQIKLESTAGTGYYYVTKKNPRNITEKMVMKKYDSVVSSKKVIKLLVKNSQNPISVSWSLLPKNIWVVV